MQIESKQTRAVGFDLDGTIVDTLPDLCAAVNAALGMLGAPVLSEASVKALVGDGAEQLLARAVLASESELAAPGADVGPGKLDAAMELFFDFYREHLFVHSRLYPDTVRTLRALTEGGIAVCCVTNKASRFALPLLELAGLSPFFRFVLCADRTEDRKPSPRMLLEACRRLEVAPHEFLYVGDAHTDVMSAHAAGCVAAAVTFGYHRQGAFERVRPDGMFDTLAAVATSVLHPLEGELSAPARIQENPA